MRLKFTNPWWVVVGAVTGLFVCNGPVLGFTFGVFLKPIMADTGWPRSTTSFALSFGGILGAVTVPVLGRMMDRWSIRRVALPGLAVYTLFLSLMGLAPAVLWIFILMFALAEMTSAIQTPLGYAKAISAWFDRRRGLALGIAMSGVGLGAFVVPQLAQQLIERVGWRGAYVSLGLMTFVIAFPAVATWIREPRPGEGERGGGAAIAMLPGHTVREAAGTTRFWMLGTAFFLVAVGINGSAAHIVPLLTDHGLSAASATATLGIFGLATMGGRLLAGFLVDRIFAPYVATFFFLAPIAGFAVSCQCRGYAANSGCGVDGNQARHRDRPDRLSRHALFRTTRFWPDLRLFLHDFRPGVELWEVSRRAHFRPGRILQSGADRRRLRACCRGHSRQPPRLLPLPSPAGNCPGSGTGAGRVLSRRRQRLPPHTIRLFRSPAGKWASRLLRRSSSA